MTTCCGPQCSWQNLGGQIQHRELPCQALGEVRFSFNFVISFAVGQTYFAQHGSQDTEHNWATYRMHFILGD